MRERYGDEFEAAMGAEAIQDLLKEDVYKRQAKALRKLRHPSRAKRLRDYLDE